MVEDFQLRFQRGDRHLRTVEELVAASTSGRAARAAGGLQADDDPPRPPTGADPDPITELSAVIGDCVHDLRTALDNLAWRLAGKEAHPHTAFPVFKDRGFFQKHARAGADYRGHGGSMMAGMSPEAQAAIESLQPFARPHGREPTAEALWILHRLDMEERHYSAAITVGPSVTFDVAGPAAGLPVVECLVGCRDAVEEAILALEDLLPPRPAGPAPSGSVTAPGPTAS